LSRDDRYSRQTRFTPIGEEGQRRLASSRVLLIGLGALGTVVADQVVRAGVGFLRMVDRDFVELSNLQRQSLFDEEDVKNNLPKAVAAEAKLRRVNSAVRLDAKVDDVNPTNIEDYIADVDLVLDGLDNFETKALDLYGRGRELWFSDARHSWGDSVPALSTGQPHGSWQLADMRNGGCCGPDHAYHCFHPGGRGNEVFDRTSRPFRRSLDGLRCMVPSIPTH